MVYNFSVFYWKRPVMPRGACDICFNWGGQIKNKYTCYLEIRGAMAAECDRKNPRTPSREGQPSPESSLTWCLTHISKSGSGSERQGQSGSGGARETDKRSKVSQWRALVAIRTQHIKGGKAGIARFRGQGGLRHLLDLIKHPECSRKTLDLALSILGNCCTELETRIEVRQEIIVEFVY